MERYDYQEEFCVMNETAYYPDEIANVLCKIAFDGGYYGSMDR